MPSHFLKEHPKNVTLSFWFLKPARAEQIWSGYYSYSFASSCFLNLIIVPLLSLLIHQRLFAIHTNPLLCSISETLFLSVILYLFVILRRIRGKWVQIVVGGMGSPVIRWQVMSLLSTSVAVGLKVPSIPIPPFSLFAISSDSTSLTTISITPQFHLSLVALRTWRISTSLSPPLLVISHPKSPTYPNWFHLISQNFGLRIETPSLKIPQKSYLKLENSDLKIPRKSSLSKAQRVPLVTTRTKAWSGLLYL